MAFQTMFMSFIESEKTWTGRTTWDSVKWGSMTLNSSCSQLKAIQHSKHFQTDALIQRASLIGRRFSVLPENHMQCVGRCETLDASVAQFHHINIAPKQPLA